MAEVFISHLEWTGAAKGPTRDPATFSRDLEVSMHATTLPMSSAPGYRGDASRANPEQLFVATLRPVITLHSGANEARARALVAQAHDSCFIANSVATPVDVVPAFNRERTNDH